MCVCVFAVCLSQGTLTYFCAQNVCMLNCEKQNVKCEIVRYKTMGALTVIICRILFILSWFRASGQHFQGHCALKLKKKCL